MPGYEVQIAAIREAGRAAAAAGDQAATVDLAGSIQGTPAGIPGSRAAGVLTRLVEVWRTQIAAWSGEAKALGANLLRAAEQYSANEAEAERDLFAGYTGGVRPS